MRRSKRIAEARAAKEMDHSKTKQKSASRAAIETISQVSAAPADGTFRLLDLPPEIVVRILDFAVPRSSTDDPLELDVQWRFSFQKPLISARRFLPPAVTQTCRLLRDEGQKVHYQNNTFSVRLISAELERFTAWMLQLQKAHLALIANFSIGSRLSLRRSWHHFQVQMRFIHRYANSLDLYIQQEDGKIVRNHGRPGCWYTVRVGGQQHDPRDQVKWMRVADIVNRKVKEPAGTFWVWKDGM